LRFLPAVAVVDIARLVTAENDDDDDDANDDDDDDAAALSVAAALRSPSSRARRLTAAALAAAMMHGGHLNTCGKSASVVAASMPTHSRWNQPSGAHELLHLLSH
jgi:hypothetical protein